MQINTEPIARTAKRIFGVVQILIGAVLLWNLISAAPDLLANAQTRRDVTGPLAFGLCPISACRRRHAGFKAGLD